MISKPRNRLGDFAKLSGIRKPPASGGAASFTNTYSTDMAAADGWISPNSTDFEFSGTSAFSFSFWIKPDTLASADGIFGRGTANNGGYECFYSSSLTKIRFTISGDGGFIIRDSTANPLSVGSWTHVAITYDGSEDSSGIKIYLDGSLDASTSAANTGLGDITVNGQPFVIGDDVVGRAFGGMDGHIDEFYIYSKELTSGEVSSLYAKADPTTITSLTAAYRFGDDPNDSSTNVQDTAGSINLSNVGSPSFVEDVP